MSDIRVSFDRTVKGPGKVSNVFSASEGFNISFENGLVFIARGGQMVGLPVRFVARVDAVLTAPEEPSAPAEPEAAPPQEPDDRPKKGSSRARSKKEKKG